MTDSMELPVSVPGVEQATRNMRDFHSAVSQSAQGAVIHDQATKQLSHSAQETAHHTESLTGKFKELGGELRHSAPELGRALRDIGSQFLPILVGVEAVKVAFELTFGKIEERAKDAADDVKAFGHAMSEAQKSVAEAGEKRDKKDIAYAMANKDVIGGLTAMGGNQAISFAEDLSKLTGTPIEQVNKAVLAGKHAGLTDSEIRNVVQGASLGEKLGRGKFEELASGASQLTRKKTGVDLLGGSDVDVLEKLLNREGLEKFYSPEESRKRWEEFQELRKVSHDLDRQHGIAPRNFNPVQQRQFKPAPGTSAAAIREQNARQAGTVSEDLERVGILQTGEGRATQESAIGEISPTGEVERPGNALRAAENESRKQNIEERYPGFTGLAHAYNEEAQKAFQKLTEIDAHNKVSFFGPDSMKTEKREASRDADSIARAGAATLGIPEGVFIQMAASLKAMESHMRSVDQKTKAPNAESAPK